MLTVALLLLTLESSLEQADLLLAHGAACEAATEYGRWLFEHQGDSSEPEVRLRLVRALVLSSELDRAEQELGLLPDSVDSLKSLARFALAQGYHRAGNRPRAETGFSALLATRPCPGLQREINLELAWLAAEGHEFTSSADLFDRAGDSALAAAARPRTELRNRDPELAVFLSSLVPGAGELYAGRTLHGLHVLTAGGLVTAAVVYSITRRRYLDAALLVSLLLARISSGSRANARDFAEEHNFRNRNRTLRRLQLIEQERSR